MTSVPLTSEQAELVDAQRARVPVAMGRAARKMEEQRQKLQWGPVQVLLGRAASLPGRSKRIPMLLHEAASEWANQIAPLTACRKGCSHCCHLPVIITEGEAEILAAFSGRSMLRPVSPRRVIDFVAMDEQERKEALDSAHGPCPFLGNEGECVVYEHRPFACRTHLNLDDDELLCRIVPGYPSSVPYADASQIYGYSLLIQRHEKMADIRAFFSRTTSSLKEREHRLPRR